MDAQQQAEINRLNSEIPNPWNPGTWYDAQMNNQPVQIKRTYAVKGGEYLHIRRRGIQAVRHYQTREIEHSQEVWINFRVNLRTYELKQL